MVFFSLFYWKKDEIKPNHGISIWSIIVKIAWSWFENTIWRGQIVIPKSIYNKMGVQNTYRFIIYPIKEHFVFSQMHIFEIYNFILLIL